MVNTINMQDMRHLNLFGKITRISTRFCFWYNDTLIFCVPKGLISKAIGEGGRNVKQINQIIRKKIKIIPSPSGIGNVKSFFEHVVSPTTFKELEVKDNTLKGTSEIIITAGSQSKAALIGRNKRRLLELQQIAKDFFGKELRIA